MESLSILSIEADQSLNITITVDRRNSTSDLQAQNLGIQPDSKSTFYSKLFAILVMTASSIAAGSTSVTWKMAFIDNPNMNTFDYLLIRSATFMTASAAPLIYHKVNPLQVLPKYRKWLIFVLVWSCVGVSLFYASLKYLPVVKSSIIYNVNPIIISILGIFVLKESISKFELLCIVGAFFGVFLMMNHANFENGVSIEMQMIGVLFASFSCIAGAITGLFLRFFNKDTSYVVYPFYYALVLSVFSLLLLLFPSAYNFEFYTPYSVGMFLLSGTTNVFTILLNSLAFKLGEVSVVAPFAYVTPAFNFIWDLLIFHTSFSIVDIWGILLVLFFLILKLFYVKHRTAEQSKSNELIEMRSESDSI